MSGRPPRLSPDELAGAGRDLPAAFECVLRLESAASADPPGGPLAPGEVILRVQSTLRLLPGRRLVALAEVAGQRLVAKLFFGAGAARYCEREVRGRALLAAAGVATPALLGRVRGDAGPHGRAVVHGLLTDYLVDARPLADEPAAWRGAAAALARVHRAGALHRDPHADNFLVCGAAGTVHVIDGDGVRPVLGRRPLRRRASLGNLARLCAERPPLADVDLMSVLQSYALARGWTLSPSGSAATVRALGRATRARRRERERRYLRKAQRDCTEFACQRDFRRYLIRVRGDTALDALLADPEAAMRDGELVKAGNSATVVRVTVGGRSCIIKRYNQKNAWHALRRVLKPTARFRHAWLSGHRLQLLGIPTARPLALLERRFGPLRGVAYLVMEDLGRRDLGGMPAAEVAEPVIAGVVRLFLALRAAGLRHGDTKATNFLVAGGQVALVDLDAMRPVVARSAEDVSTLDDDLRRFLANFDGRPAVRERFEAAFAAVGLLPPAPGTGGVAAAPRRL